MDKIIISSQGKHRTASVQVYITYDKPMDAAFAIKVFLPFNLGIRRDKDQGPVDHSDFRHDQILHIFS